MIRAVSWLLALALAVPISGLITHNQTTQDTPRCSAKEGQFPWQISLYQQQSMGSKYICGGTLVSQRHVVTNAHCVTKKGSKQAVDINTLTVTLGKNNFKTPEGHQEKLKVQKVLIHENYNTNNIFNNDLVILELQEAVTYSDEVQAACLWPENEDALEHIVGQKGLIASWDIEENGLPKGDLKVSQMLVVDQETCIRSYPEFYVRTTSSMTYCAGYDKGTTTCVNSGLGMFFKRDNLWYLRGIASLSVALPNEHRCDPKHYVVCTDLAKYGPWLRVHIDQE